MKKFILIITIACCVISCVEKQKVKPNVDYAPTYIGFNKESPLILIPIDIKQDELKNGSDLVMQSIEQQLINNGWKIDTLKKDKYEKLWNKITNQVGGIYSSSTGKLDSLKYQSAIGELIKILRPSGTVSGVIVPSLVLRQAKFNGGSSAVWDGSSRKMIKNGRPTKYGNFSGSTQGLSLRIIAFKNKC